MNTEDRLRKGIEYFRAIKPSEWREPHKVALTKYLDILERYLDSQQSFRNAQKIFNEKN